MRIKFHSRHSWEFKCILVCSACMFLSSYKSTVGADRPAPRKPFVSKAATSGMATKPLPMNNSGGGGAKAAVSAVDGQKNSGIAEIIMITRSHKTSSVHPVTSEQNGVVPISTQATETPVNSGSGTQAQVGKIIERQ